MPSLQKVIVESIVVGLLLIPVMYLAGFLVRKLVKKPSLPEVCSTWNENNIMEWNIFFAGFLFHLISEYSGFNKWYIQQYNR
jgi:hypothetical protein